MSANRLERKQRMAAFLRLQFDRSTLMLQAADPFQAGGFSKATENQMKEERNMADDMAMFLYRLESDFEDKRRRLERMLFYHPDVSPSHPVWHSKRIRACMDKLTQRKKNKIKQKQWPSISNNTRPAKKSSSTGTKLGRTFALIDDSLSMLANRHECTYEKEEDRMDCFLIV